MGTRCLTILPERDGGETAVLYRQFDGYPEGHGVELAEFLSGFTTVDGISDVRGPRVANGPECLSAQVIAHFKIEAGNFYLYPAGTRNLGEEYLYFIGYETGKEPTITIFDRQKEIYSGSASNVLEMLNALIDKG